MMQEKIHNLRFMIVEDDAFQRDASAMMLASLGAHHVLLAGNGNEALELLRKQETPVDIVLTDINMPELDGMAFMRQLAESNYPASVIVVSGMDDAMRDSVSAMTKAYGLNVLGAMPKPLSRSKLLSLLAQHALLGEKKTGGSPQAVIPKEEIVLGLKHGEFVPYFQPKVEMSTGRVVGVEALVRWNSPTRGLLAPGAFLDAIETLGLMDAMTWVVLAQASAVTNHWQKQGLLLFVSVNLSLTSLERVDLADRILDVVTKQGLDAASVILEVTESAVMNSIGPSLENLTRLRLHGFGLSIDDYGTGYSSLQQLARVPFTELKIDQSFVNEMVDRETMRIVVESSLDIARRLEMKVTAEGVETVEQWDLLRDMGCDIAQGYLIAKPMPADAIPLWASSWSLSAIHSPNEKKRAVNILLVEDEPFQRESYAEILQQFQLGRVDVAQDVDEAILRMASMDYDLIISDIDLGGSSGLSLTRSIRAHQTPANPATRVILLSTHTEQDAVFRSIALDINGYLAKPAKPSKLREAIQQALDEVFTPQDPAYYLHADAHETGANQHFVDQFGAVQPIPGNMRVPLVAVEPGAILAEAIYDLNQTVVIQSGFALSPTIINRLLEIREHLASPDVCVISTPHT